MQRGLRLWSCLSVCLSHLTSGASVHRENTAKYSAGNEGQKICGIFPLLRSSAPSLDGHRSGHTENTHVDCAYTSS